MGTFSDHIVGSLMKASSSLALMPALASMAASTLLSISSAEAVADEAETSGSAADALSGAFSASNMTTLKLVLGVVLELVPGVVTAMAHELPFEQPFARSSSCVTADACVSFCRGKQGYEERLQAATHLLSCAELLAVRIAQARHHRQAQLHLYLIWRILASKAENMVRRMLASDLIARATRRWRSQICAWVEPTTKLLDHLTNFLLCMTPSIWGQLCTSDQCLQFLCQLVAAD